MSDEITKDVERDIRLMDFLNGHLNETQTQALLEDLNESPRLRQRLAELESLFALVSATPPEIQIPEQAPVDLKKRLMQTINNAHPLDRFCSKVARLLQISLERASTYINQLNNPQSWEMLPLPGVSLYHVEGGPNLSNAITGFVRLRRGAVFPDHEHAGVEHLLVLQGTLLNSGKDAYGPGDIFIMDEDTHHYLEAGPDEDVLYLSVIDKGIRMFGVFIDPDSPLM